MQISNITDADLVQEISRRFQEKQASIQEMEFMTKKLLDLNEKNKDSQEIKSQFLSLIKNEFNNPMSSLLNISNMMLKKATDPKIENLSIMMKEELLKLDFSLKNIFAASEIEAGEIANDYTKIDFKLLVGEVIDYFSILIKEKNLTVDYINECDAQIISDSQKLNLILLNLISNACEYSYANSAVQISLESNDVEHIISVEDSGEGVYEEHTKNIYNRFAHFETGKTRARAGLGLGLSVTRGLVEALEGTIDNISKDGKTIFLVKIKKIDENSTEYSNGMGANEFMFESADGMVEF